MTKYLVTGGSGFIGRAVVARLIQAGHSVRVLDNNLRGASESLPKEAELIEADIRDAAAVEKACKGIDAVFHLAYLNGTEFFYTKPELVLEIGVKGMTNIIDGCIKNSVKEIFLASSSEVYAEPEKIPTDESASLTIPDIKNPRFSYSAGKIISESMIINFGRAHFKRAIIFRPHNVYGPNMGWEHVIPQFCTRILQNEKEEFEIQGSGDETRAFIYIDDFADGLMRIAENGKHLEIYNIGTMEEIKIADVAEEVANALGKKIRIIPGKKSEGSPDRRCPDTSKLQKLGFEPKISFAQGIRKTAQWYKTNLYKKPKISEQKGKIYER